MYNYDPFGRDVRTIAPEFASAVVSRAYAIDGTCHNYFSLNLNSELDHFLRLGDKTVGKAFGKVSG